MKRLLGLLLAAGLLAGCYTSETLLLDSGQAQAPLATGRQTTAGGDDKPQAVDISLGADRWYTMRAGGEDQRMLFTPLPGGAAGETRYIYAEQGHADHGAPGFLYGLAIRRGGQLYFDIPNCAEPLAHDAAAAHGAAPPPSAGKTALSPTCTFTDRAALLGAMADYADHADPKRDLAHLPAAS